MKKGISSIIVVILILLITISLVVLSYQWLLKYTPRVQEELEQHTESKEGCLKIENIDIFSRNVVIRNCGDTELSNFIIYIDEEPVARHSLILDAGNVVQIGFSKDLSKGEHDIQVSSDYAKAPKIIFYTPIPTIMCTYPAFGDWNIYEDIICSNQLIIINGDIRIYSGGSLTFYNVTLKMNNTNNLEYGIEVLSGGKMFIYDNDNSKDTNKDASNITTGPYDETTRFFFQVRGGSQFEMKNSYLSQCGYWGAGTTFAGLCVYADNSVIENNILDNNYRAIQIRDANNCTVSKNTVKNSDEYGILIVNYPEDSQNNIVSDNILIDNVHNIHICNGANNNTITGNIISGGTYGIYLHYGSGGPSLYGKYIDNSIDSATYGIYISENSSYNLFANSSITNSGLYDYYLTDATSTNNFTNMNFINSQTIHFYDTISWFNYNNRTDIELWLRTNVSSEATITRELTNWDQDSLQWNDTSDTSTITTTYNITGLTPNTLYYIYNNSILAYTLSTDSSGDLGSFTIYLPQDEGHEIKVEKSTDFVLWVKFDEGEGTVAYDSSGYGNDGNLYGDTSWITDCISGNCLGFEGDGGDYVDCGGDSSLNFTGPITISVWVKPGNNTGKQWARFVTVPNTFAMPYVLGLGGETTRVQFGYNFTGENYRNRTSLALLTEGNWHHVVGVGYGNGAIKIYVDGVESSLTTVEEINYTSGTNLYIGNRQDNHAQTRFNGTIDEVKIWNRALTEEEIIEEYEKYTPFDSVLWFKFDEGSGTTAYDSSGYGNDGTLYNGSEVCSNGYCPTWTSDCIFGNCLEFDGLADYVEATTTGMDNTSKGTVMAWVKVAGPGDLPGNQENIFSHRVGSTDTRIYLVKSDGSSMNFVIGIGNDAYIDTGSDFVLDGWAHIVLVWDNGNYYAYMNGSEVDSGTYPYFDDLNPTVYVGTFRSTDLKYSFNGTIDELKIWNRALTEEEIIEEYQKYTPFNGVLFFNFNEARGTDVFDSSMFNNDGTFYGETFADGTLYNRTTICSNPPSAACPEWVDGVFGKALKFDGTYDHVTIPLLSSLNITGNETTVAAWVNPYGKNRGGTGQQWQHLVDNHPSYFIDILEDRNFTFRIETDSGTEYADGITQAVLGSWYYVTGVYNGTHVLLYLNGTLDAIETHSGDLVATDNTNLLLGKYQNDWSYDFYGIVDEVRIWNRSLNETEIQYEMNSQFPVSRPVASWSFEENSGTIANDTHIWVNGTFGSALSFDGSIDDYVEVPDYDDSLDVSNLTISTWLKFADDYGSRLHVVLRKRQGNTGYLIYISTSGRITLDYYNGSDGCYPQSNSLTWGKNVWYFVTVTHDEITGETRFYRDGNPVGTGAVIEEDCKLIAPNNEVFRIAYSGTMPWNGAVDVLKIWDRVLSQVEIQEEMNKE